MSMLSNQNKFSILKIIGVAIGIIIFLVIILGEEEKTSEERKVEEAASQVLETIERVKKQAEEEELQQKQVQKCDWYKDKCPNGLVKSLNPSYGNDPKVVGEEFGLVFVNKSFISEGIPPLKEILSLNCCKSYYPKTETAIDWGVTDCVWEVIPGHDMFCISDMDLCNPFSERENTFIFKCMANTETYYWCCPK